jgi:hypothetical protein
MSREVQQLHNCATVPAPGHAVHHSLKIATRFASRGLLLLSAEMFAQRDPK